MYKRQLVGTATVPLSSFLEPWAGATPLVLHERVALDLEPEFQGQGPFPEVVISLELNPELLADEFKLKLEASSEVLYDDGA